jgi:hypothetical protein
MDFYAEEPPPTAETRIVYHDRPSARGRIGLIAGAILALGLLAFVGVFFWAASASGAASPLVSADAQAVDLQNQINDLHHEVDRLVAIVGAAFGVIVTLAVLIVGFNLFSSQWAYERDRKAMAEDLIASMNDSQRKTVLGMRSESRRSLAELESTTREEIQVALDGYERRTSQSLDDRFKRLDRDVVRANWNTMVGLSRNAELTGNLGTALYFSGLALATATVLLERFDDDKLETSLKLTQNLILRPSLRLRGEEADQFLNILQRVPEAFEVEKENIRMGIAAARNRAKDPNAKPTLPYAGPPE